MDPDRRLEGLRERIREVDQLLVALAAERVELAREVGETKRAQKRPTVDFAQERVVLDRARAAAAGKGLDPAVAEDLVARLIRASVIAQEQDNLRLSGTGAGKTAVVVGGAGRMGRWMGRFLETQGYAVAALDPQAPPAEDAWARERLPGADLVACASPPLAVAALYESWTARPPSGLVFDLASIKTPLLEPIRRLREAGGRVASIHPMFGPSIALLRDADVVVCDTGDAESTAAVVGLFSATTARLVRLAIAEHDRIMADVLALAHATAIAFALSLPPNLSLSPDGHQVRSTTFQALQALAAEVVRESPEVYYEIQADNPHAAAAVARLGEAVGRIDVAVRGRRPDEFRRLLEEGQGRTR